MTDITDIGEYRERVQEELQKKDKPAMLPCPGCGDKLYWVVPMPDMDAGALVCQHCTKAVGLMVFFDEPVNGDES